jgi:hypothetical protein
MWKCSKTCNGGKKHSSKSLMIFVHTFFLIHTADGAGAQAVVAAHVVADDFVACAAEDGARCGGWVILFLAQKSVP